MLVMRGLRPGCVRPAAAGMATQDTEAPGAGDQGSEKKEAGSAAPASPADIAPARTRR
jgi:hypothetical protein